MASSSTQSTPAKTAVVPSKPAFASHSPDGSALRGVFVLDVLGVRELRCQAQCVFCDIRFGMPPQEATTTSAEYKGDSAKWSQRFNLAVYHSFEKLTLKVRAADNNQLVGLYAMSVGRELTSGGKRWLTLLSPEQDSEYVGEICVNWAYEIHHPSAAEKEAYRRSTPSKVVAKENLVRYLLLKVTKARGVLSSMGAQYVRCQVADKVLRTKSAPAARGVWDEFLRFPLKSRQVILSLHESSTGGFDFFLGQAQLKIEHLQGEAWLTLRPRPEHPEDQSAWQEHKNFGELYVKYQIIEFQADDLRAQKLALFSGLRVEAVQATNLLSAQGVVGDIFCHFTYGSQEEYTSYAKAEAVVWGHAVDFQVKNRSSTLRFAIWGLDVSRTAKFLGQVEFDPAERGEEGEQTLSLGPRDRIQEDAELWETHGSFGDLLIRWRFLSDEVLSESKALEDVRRKEKQEFDTIWLDVVEACNLFGPDLKGDAISPVISLKLSDTQAHTRALQATRSPIFGEFFEFPIKDVNDPLILSVLDSARGDQLVGQAIFDIAVEPHSSGKKWCRLCLPGGDNVSVPGEVFIRWRYVHLESINDKRRKLKQQKVQKFHRVWVTVVKARRLFSAGEGEGSLYVNFGFGKQEATTPQTTREPAPEWKHTHTFRVEEVGHILSFTVLNKAGDAEAQMLGQAIFDVAAEDTNGGAGWLVLQPPGETYKLLNSHSLLGEIYIQWGYVTDPEALESDAVKSVNRHEKVEKYTGIDVEIAETRGLDEEVVKQAELTWEVVSPSKIPTASQGTNTDAGPFADAGTFAKHFALGNEQAQLHVAVRDGEGNIVGYTTVDVAGKAEDAGEAWIPLDRFNLTEGVPTLPTSEPGTRPEILMKWKFGADPEKLGQLEQARIERRQARSANFTHVQIFVTQARNLKAYKNAQPHVRLAVSDDSMQRRSRAVEDAENPIFAEVFEVNIKSERPQGAKFSVWDSHKGSMIGQCFLDVLGEEADEGHRWLTLLAADEVHVGGRLHVGWCFANAEQLEKQEAVRQQRRRWCCQIFSTLKVTLVGGRAISGFKSSKNPLQVQVQYGEQQKTSTKAEDTVCPVWNEDMGFDVIDADERLRLIIIDDTGEPACEVVLDPAADPNSTGDGWFALQSLHSHHRVPMGMSGLGELHVRWEYGNLNRDRKEKDTQLQLTRLQKKSHFSHLSIKVKAARRLAIPREGAKPNPLAMVQFGSQTYRTFPIPNSVDPRWGQEFDFPLMDPMAQLSVTMWDSNTEGYSFLGYVHEDIMTTSWHTGSVWLPLSVHPNNTEEKRLGPQGVTDFGEVEVEWLFYNSMARHDDTLTKIATRIAKSSRFDELRLCINTAKDVGLGAGLSSIPGYVKCQLNGQHYRTRVIASLDGTYQFGEIFTFAIYQNEEPTELKISAWARNESEDGEDTWLGEVSYDVLAEQHVEGSETLQLQPRPGNAKDYQLMQQPTLLGSVAIEWSLANSASELETASQMEETRAEVMANFDSLRVRVPEARNLPQVRSEGVVQDMKPLIIVCHGYEQHMLDDKRQVVVPLSKDQLHVIVKDTSTGQAIGYGSLEVFEDAALASGQGWVQLQPTGIPAPYTLAPGHPILGEVFVEWEGLRGFAEQEGQRSRCDDVAQNFNQMVLTVHYAEITPDVAEIEHSVPDPYVYLKNSTSPAQQTSTVWQKLNPVWLEEFAYPMTTEGAAPISLVVQDASRHGKFIGRAKLDVAGGPNSGEKFLDLMPRERNPEEWRKFATLGTLGKLLVSWEFVNDEVRTAHRQTKMQDYSAIQVEILESQGMIQPEDDGHLAVAARWGTSSYMPQTRPVPADNPRWAETAEFELKSEDDVLLLQLENTDPKAENPFLGEGTLDTNALEASSGESWVPLRPRTNNLRDRNLLAKNGGGLGQILVRWKYIDQNEDWQREKAAREARKVWMESFSMITFELVEAKGLVGVSANNPVWASVCASPGKVFSSPPTKMADGVWTWKDVIYELNTETGVGLEPLEVTVRGKEPFDDKSTVVGVCKIDICSAEKLENDVWVTLQRPDMALPIAEDVPMFGQIRLRYAFYTPDTLRSREDENTVQRANNLDAYTHATVTISQAEGLSITEGQSFAHFLFGESRFATPVSSITAALSPRMATKGNAGNVSWGTSFRVPLHQLGVGPESKGSVGLWDTARLYAAGDLIGQAEVDILASLSPKGETWIVLEPRTDDAASRLWARNSRQLGQVLVQWELFADKEEAAMQQKLSEKRHKCAKKYSALWVEVSKTRDLYLGPETQSADPFSASATLLLGECYRSTTNQPLGTEVAWNELMWFDDVQADLTLYMMVTQMRLVGNHKPAPTGHALLDIMAEESQGEKWLTLKENSDHEEAMKKNVLRGRDSLGEVLIRWGFLTADEMSKRKEAKASTCAVLELVVEEARDLGSGPSDLSMDVSRVSQVFSTTNNSMVSTHNTTAPSSYVAATLGGSSARFTSLVVDSRNPCWNSTFQFPLESSRDKLSLCVYNRRMTADEELGTLTVDLLVESGNSGSQWFLLEAPSVPRADANNLRWLEELATSKRPSAVRLGWTFLSDAEIQDRESNRQARSERRFHQFTECSLSIVKARNLLIRDPSRVPKPHAQLQWGDQENFVASSMPTANPIWNAAFSLELVEAAQVLSVKVRDQNEVDGPTLGQFQFDPLGEEQDAGSKWITLRPELDGSQSLANSMETTWSCVSELGDVLISWELSYNAEARQERDTQRALRKAKLDSYSTVRLCMKSASTLIPTVPSPDIMAFAVCSFGSHQVITPMADPGVLSPVWDYSQDLTLQSAADCLKVNVYDESRNLIGHASLDILAQPETSLSSLTIPIMAMPTHSAPSQKAGVVTLGWEYLSTQSCLKASKKKVLDYTHVDFTVMRGANLHGVASFDSPEDIVAQVKYGADWSFSTMPSAKDGDCALWAQSFRFPIEGPDAKVSISLAPQGGGESLGNCDFDIMAASASGRRWLLVEDASLVKGTHAHVLVGWQFVDNRPGQELRAQSFANFNAVSVTVVGARGLKQGQGEGLDDPDIEQEAFGMVRYGTQGAAQSTPKVPSNPDPVWQSELAFDCMDKDADLDVTIFGGLPEGQCLGHSTLDIAAWPTPEGEAWIPLRPREGVPEEFKLWHGHMQDLGEVKVAWKFYNDLDKRVNREAKLAKSKVLRVSMEQVRGLITTDVRETMGYYMQVEYGPTRDETQVVYTGAASWPESIDLPVNATSDRLRVILRSHRLSGETFFMGEAILDPASESSLEGSAWTELQLKRHPMTVIQGEVLVSWKYVDASELTESQTFADLARSRNMLAYTHVRMIVAEARSLLPSGSGPSDSTSPFVTVLSGDCTKMTPASQGGFHPRWLADLGAIPLSAKVQLTVQDANQESNPTMGTAVWDVLGQQDTSGSTWVRLDVPEQHTDHHIRAGDVRIMWELVHEESSAKRRVDTAQRYRGLVVEAVEANGLAKVCPSDSMQTYAVLSLSNSLRRTRVGLTGPNPVWSETVYFDLQPNELHPDVSKDFLNVTVYHQDQNLSYGPNIALGTTSLDLLGKDFGDVSTTTLDLCASPDHLGHLQGPLKSTTLGNLMLKWHFLTESDVQKLKQDKQVHFSMIQVEILGARGLPRPSHAMRPKPYAILTLGDAQQRTGVYGESEHPQWKETLEFELQHNNTSQVGVDVYSRHDGKDECIGQARFFPMLQPNSKGDAWIPLGPPGKPGMGTEAILCGDIHLRWRYINDIQRRVARHEKINKYHSVWVVIDKASGLLPEAPKRCYAKVSFAGTIANTDPLEGAPDHEWGSSFNFKLGDRQDRLKLSVYEHVPNKKLPDLFAGGLSLDVLGEMGSEGQMWIPLKHTGITPEDRDFAMPLVSQANDLGMVLVKWRFLTEQEVTERRQNKAQVATVIRVRVRQGRKFTVPKSLSMGRTQPFLRITYADETVQTTCAKQVDNPIWTDEFSFDLGPVPEVVALELLQRDQFGESFSLGKAEVDVALEEGSQGERWVDVVPTNQEAPEILGNQGQLLMEWEFFNDMELREKRKAKSHVYDVLTVRVLSANDLLVENKASLPSPYACVEFGSLCKRTRAVLNQVNPKWGQDFVLPMDKPSDMLKVSVWDRNRVEGDKCIGMVSIDVAGMDESKGFKAFMLESKSEDGSSTVGDVVLEWKYTTMSEIRAHMGRAKACYSDVKVHIMCATNLRNDRPYDRVDPKVHAQLGNQGMMSPALSKTRFPIWDEFMDFSLEGAIGPLRLSVYDAHGSAEDSFLGEVEVDIWSKAPECEGWFVLLPKGHEHSALVWQGEVFLRWTFSSFPSESPERPIKKGAYTHVVVDVYHAKGLAGPYVALEGPSKGAYIGCSMMDGETKGDGDRMVVVPGTVRKAGACNFAKALTFKLEPNQTDLHVVLYEGVDPTDKEIQHPIGQAFLKLSGATESTGRQWLTVLPRRWGSLVPGANPADYNADLGQVLVGWNFVYDQDRAARRERLVQKCHILNLEVVKASIPGVTIDNVLDLEEDGTPAKRPPNPYVRVQCLGTKQDTRVYRAMSEKDPVWRSEMVFKIAPIPTPTQQLGDLPPYGIHLEMFDRGDSGQGDQSLGLLQLDLAGEESEKGEGWYSLVPNRLKEGQKWPADARKVYLKWRFQDQVGFDREWNQRQKVKAFSGLQVTLMGQRGLCRKWKHKKIRAGIVPTCQLKLKFGPTQSYTAQILTDAEKKAKPESWGFRLLGQEDVLEAEVWDMIEGGIEIPMGRLSIDVGAMKESEGTKWLPLRLMEGMKSKIEDLGDLQIRWKYNLVPPTFGAKMHELQLQKLKSGLGK